MKLLASSVIIGSCAMLMACASTPKAPSANIPAVQVNQLTINLKQKYSDNKFYSHSEMTDYLKNCLNQELSKINKLDQQAQAPKLNISIDYQRIFAGEAFGMKDSLGNAIVDYQYQILQGDQVLHHGKKDNQQANRGIVGTFTLWQLDRTKESENGYLDTVCKNIVEQIY